MSSPSSSPSKTNTAKPPTKKTKNRKSSDSDLKRDLQQLARKKRITEDTVIELSTLSDKETEHPNGLTETKTVKRPTEKKDQKRSKSQGH